MKNLMNFPAAIQLVIALLSFQLSAATFAATATGETEEIIKCQAIHRTEKAETKKEIPQVFRSTAMVKYEIDIGQFYYSLTIDFQLNEYWILMSRGPEYQNGVSLKGSFVQGQPIKAGWVFPDQVAQVICEK